VNLPTLAGARTKRIRGGQAGVMATMSIGRAVTWLAEQDPDRISVRDDRGAVTRRQLDLASNRLARAYIELGLRVDDLVTIGLPNSAEYYVAAVAIWKAGAIPQPVSSRLPRSERQAIVDLANPRLVLGGDPDDHPGRRVLPAGWQPPAGTDDGPLPDVHASSWKAPTSGGSTGRPKIILSGTPATVDPETPTVAYIPRDAVQLVPGPLYHNGPFIYSMRGLLTGHTLVVLPRFDAEATLAAVARWRVTWMLLVPTMMQRIWRLPEATRAAYDVSSIDAVIHLGAPCPEWLKRAWIDWLGPERVTEVYAGTESQGVTFITGTEWLERPGSVGRAAPGFRFRILDADGADVAPGVVGEIFMMPARGPGSTYRYLGAEARSVDGWESLGDLGSMDAEGYVYVADRSADLILSGGANIYPAEIEAVLDEHPDVRSSAVIGLPDDDLGERTHAIVDTAGTATDPDDLIAWVGARLARYKVPRSLEVVDDPLRDDSGKVRRSALRAARLPGAGPSTSPPGGAAG
jgi:bile acid-coenzyme A ligase